MRLWLNLIKQKVQGEVSRSLERMRIYLRTQVIIFIGENEKKKNIGREKSKKINFFIFLQLLRGRNKKIREFYIEIFLISSSCQSSVFG